MKGIKRRTEGREKKEFTRKLGKEGRRKRRRGKSEVTKSIVG